MNIWPTKFIYGNANVAEHDMETPFPLRTSELARVERGYMQPIVEHVIDHGTYLRSSTKQFDVLECLKQRILHPRGGVE